MLKSADLIAVGIRPGPLFGKIMKECSTIEEALICWEGRPQEVRQSGVKMIEGSVWEWLCRSEFFKMCSKEIPGELASNSEKRRWLANGSIKLNGEFPGPDSPLPETRWELIFFPTSPFRITML